MVSVYKFLFLIFLFFQLFLRTFCSFKNTNDIILKQFVTDKNQEPREEVGEPQDPKEKANPYDKEDIFKEYEFLLEKGKELQQIYDSEYLNFMEKENQLKIDKTHIILLIIISCLLSILIILYSCYEIYKCRKNKNKMNLYKESFNQMKSFRKEFRSSFESSKSSDDPNKKDSSFNQSQNDDLKISSNYNIIVKDIIKEKKKEEEIINAPENYNEDEAPIQLYEKNINNNIYNDDMKTLTNDENVYFASKTDKLLYKPYSNEEVNNK